MPLVVGMFVWTDIRTEGNFGPLVNFCRRQWRIFLFLFIYWYAAGCSNFYRIWLRGKVNRIEVSVGEWYLCLYQSWGMSLANGTSVLVANAYASSNCPHPYVPSFGPLVWVSLSILCAAAVFPLVFACDTTILKWWWSVCRSRRPSTVSISLTGSGSGTLTEDSPRDEATSRL